MIMNIIKKNMTLKWKAAIIQCQKGRILHDNHDTGKQSGMQSKTKI